MIWYEKRGEILPNFFCVWYSKSIYIWNFLTWVGDGFVFKTFFERFQEFFSRDYVISIGIGLISLLSAVLFYLDAPKVYEMSVVIADGNDGFMSLVAVFGILVMGFGIGLYVKGRS